eukprot:CAMPEP_0170642730 /NCGR_PEP_ID=MMETSP0224-20130122/41488_1 /TAXON_ID=285029 /ORGANISM="Togula jolla, Strain CCCM 725" /LENGTH=39 /DNA_ID= /DNA_START= /DNA_END= /DNA_ORIENTATION=
MTLHRHEAAEMQDADLQALWQHTAVQQPKRRLDPSPRDK